MNTIADSADITHNEPLFDRVRRHLPAWEQIGAPAIILQWIKEGVSFPLTHPITPFFHSQINHSPDALHYWHTKLKTHYLASGAIERIPPPQKHEAFVSKCFFVPKSSSGYRLVVDLREINTHFEPLKIKFEDLGLLRYASLNVQVGSKIDLSDAYHHLALHKSLR